MTTREKFKRRVIELIHGLPYEEAIEKEVRKGCLFLDNNEDKCELMGKVVNRSPIEKKSLYRYQMMDRGRWGAENIFSVYEKGITTIKDYKIIGLPITIGRVMQALTKIDQEKRGCSPMTWVEYHFQADLGKIESFEFSKSQKRETKAEDVLIERKFICNWKLTKENGEECTDDDQTDETIEKLYNLIK